MTTAEKIVEFQLAQGMSPRAILLAYYRVQKTASSNECYNIIAKLNASFLKDLATDAKLKLVDLILLFKDSRVIKVFKAIGFSFANLYKLFRTGFRAMKDIQSAIAEYAKQSGIGRWTAKQLDSERLKGIDEWLKNHPKTKRITGAVVAGILVYIWWNMTFVGNPAFDFNMSDMLAALGGSFSMAKIFSGTQGAALLLLFLTGSLGLTFPWPGPNKIKFAVAVVGTLATKLGKRMRKAGYYKTNAIDIDDIAERWATNNDKIYDASMPLMYSVNDLWKHREYSWTRGSSRDGLARIKGKTVHLTGPLKWDAIKADLSANGWDKDEPLHLEVGKNGEAKVGEGNHRLAIARDLGMSKVPVWVHFRQNVQKSPPPPKTVELNDKATKELVKESPKKMTPEEQEQIDEIMELLGMKKANQFLNTPPTKLRRDLESESDPAKRQQMQKALNAWRLTQPGPFRKTTVMQASDLTRLAKEVLGRAGQDYEDDHIRIHQFMNSLKVWDLTNAGKRGKKVDIMTVMATHVSKENMLDNHFKAIKLVGRYDRAVSLLRDMLHDYPDDFELHFDWEKGVDIKPAGFRPVTIKTKSLMLEADYDSFVVKDLVDTNNEPTCIPAISGGKRDIKVFYRWVSDNESKIRNMDFGEVVSEMRKNGIKYHRYCAMD